MDDSRKHHPTIHACTTFVITGKNFENMCAIILDVDFMSAALSIFMTGNSFTITLVNLISGRKYLNDCSISPVPSSSKTNGHC